ncbi:hypothetical protein Pcinc_041719 [Petrolisthes cinctipes]|uniref:PPM-type phosphatase domain-containing protein n=1 Tax=Petrolisthes cinctipes TaxID=88211 RepID=A0AAE1BLH0_PETCI|nr:hypothetical protein Pcinc_041719 [Petrolisthes cinctipes]
MTGLRNNDTWTDGLPICKLSGVGMSANQMYREDGTPCSEHEYEDRSIHFCLDRENSTFLYGVFDGHDGAKAAYFASQRMPAELSFEQLTGKTTEEEVKEVFREAFLAVENAFLESIDPKIAERTQLLDKIPDGMSQFEAAQNFPETFSRLQALDQEIRGGTTAVVALVYGGRLHVGNLGDSRALLCIKDKSGVLKVKQLTADHTTSSHDELQRLAALNLPTTKIHGAKFGNHELTRCIGNYFMKGGYKEFDILSSAASEPVIPEPHIRSIPIDESCSFLLLMSDGLYKSYQDATGSEQVNKEIAQMVVEQFVEQPTLTSIAQTVVDKVVRLHHDNYLTKRRNVTTRDDITLIIRNFNFQLRGALTPGAGVPLPGSVSPRLPPRPLLPLPLPQITGRQSQDEDDDQFDIHRGDDLMGPLPLHHHHHIDTNTTSTESSDLQNPSLTQFSLDEDGRIHPYVNFDLYYQAIDEAKYCSILVVNSLLLCTVRMALVAVSSWGPARLVGRGIKWLWNKNKPLAITAVVVVSAIKINSYITKKKRRNKWNNAGRDVVVLHMFQRGKYAPSVSPYVIKLEMYLRMSDIQYQIDYDEPLGPKGKSPWITLNGEDIADSQIIIEKLGAKFGKDFSNHLLPEQRALSHALRIMTDEHFVCVIAYWRYVEQRGRPLMNGMEFPFYVWFLLPRYLKTIKRTLWLQGIGRHSVPQIEEMGRQDIRALSVTLGEKPFMMGDQPSEVDCSAFGILAQVVWNSPNSPYLNMLHSEFPNLLKYCHRVKERFWPDWNKCLQPPQN